MAKNTKNSANVTATVTATKGKNAASKNGKATKTKPESTERKPRAKKEGLRSGQSRILATLARIKGKGGMTCAQLAEECVNGHEGWTRHFLGSDKPENREVNRKYLGGRETLQCLKAVESFESQLDSRKVTCYRITAKGRELLKAQQKLDNAK